MAQSQNQQLSFVSTDVSTSAFDSTSAFSGLLVRVEVDLFIYTTKTVCGISYKQSTCAFIEPHVNLFMFFGE